MTKAAFHALLIEHNISTNLVHFENSTQDGFYMLNNHFRYEVFFRERGKDYNCVGFPSESDALSYLADKLIYR